jgi:peptide/nickel transport system substrate-binding protein
MGLFAAETAGANYAEWTNPEWQSRWAQFAEVRDPEGQQQLVNEMLEIWYDDPPWLMLYFQPDFYGVSNRIDWEPRRDEDVSVYSVRPK